jgi:MFS family permease
MRGCTSVVRCLLADRRIRGVELAFLGFGMAEYGVWVSVLVYAYERGGSTVAALVAVAQLVPAGIVAPLAARTTDRRGGATVLYHGYAFQALTLSATSLLLFEGAPDMFVYAAAVLAASAVTVTRPAQAALLPMLVEGSDQLTGVSVLSGWVESASVLAGPALAGLLITLDGPAAAIAGFAALLMGSTLLLARRELHADHLRPVVTADDDAAGFRTGLAVVREDRDLAALLALLGAEYLVIGVLDVLLVVLAISELGLGPSGAGYLNAAFGAGGVIGSFAAISLIGRGRLAGPLLGAAVVWALVLVLLGAWPTALGALLLLCVAGLTRSVLDVSSRTILLRAAPEDVRGRVFGLLEGIAMLGLAIGSMLVPALMSLGSPSAALIATGVLLSAFAILPAAKLRRLDEHSAVRSSALRLARSAYEEAELSAPALVLAP